MINGHHGYKTFLAALEHIYARPTEAKKFLSDKRLTTQEKKILIFFFKIRENDFSLISELIDDTSFQAVPFLNGLRYYFLGITFLYKAESKKSEEYLLKAMPLLGESFNERFLQRMTFKASANLFYVYANLKRMDEMEEQYKKVSTLGCQSEEDQVSMKILEICYYLVKGLYSKAEEALEEAESMRPKMNHIQVMGYLVEKFDFYIKIDHFSKASKVLDEMKKHRTFRLSANFQYMDKLLKFISANERFYVYPKDFVEHEDLFLMISVIKSLDEADLQGALQFWQRLERLSPQTFKPSFQYCGDKCLFSLSLEKTMLKGQDNDQMSVDESDYSEQELILIRSIQNSIGRQVKKEDLFQTVYGREFQDKSDLVSLSSVIYRINKKGQFSIKSKKGCYYLADAIDKVG